MKRVSLKFGRLSVPGKVAKARSYVSSMTGNANFTTPNPTLASIDTAADDLETAWIDAQAGGVTETAIMYQKEAELTFAVTLLGIYVDGIAQGDVTIILSSGMDAQRDPSPIGPLPQVQNLSAVNSDMEGVINLGWDSIYGARVYIIEMSDDGNNWTSAGGETKSSSQRGGLVPGNRYWFRVAAFGTAGLGPWSDVAIKMAV